MKTRELTPRDWRAIVLAGTLFGAFFIAFGLHTAEVQAYKWIQGKGKGQTVDLIRGARAAEIGWAHVCIGAALFAPWFRRYPRMAMGWFILFVATAIFLLL